ncbi:hypothetical protein J2S00_002134 [Caldalkalibacillus uzonensis]|uniref:Uncharacterized protein n=1 Tax=Caldalkalibacillus uzonensis TaxID=353224 RepID=A0ABU0CWC3_9BACI|nr:hypothetical protein [Caldalkalibacillus uzonensis]
MFKTGPYFQTALTVNDAKLKGRVLKIIYNYRDEMTGDNREYIS